MTDEMEEIWALYADDGAQALDAMETALEALDTATGAAAEPHVAALFRAVHTFKGNSRVLGLGVVESRAHLAEDLIGLVRDSGVAWDAEIRDIMLETADVLRAMLESTARLRKDVDPAPSQALADRLQSKIARCTGQAPDLPDPAPEPVWQAEPDFADAMTDPPLPADAPAEAEVPPTPARLADDPVYRRIFDDMAAETLDRLMAALRQGDAAAAVRPVDDLAHAARQIGLDDWQAALSLDGAAPDLAAVQALVLRLGDLAGRDLTAELAGIAIETDDAVASSVTDAAAPEATPAVDKTAKVAAAGPAAPGPDGPEAALPMATDILERLGEIAVGQSMVHGSLTDLAGTDLADLLLDKLREIPGIPAETLKGVKDIAEDIMRRLQETAASEAQLSAQMAEVQQQAAQMRTRPAARVLARLQDLVAMCAEWCNARIDLQVEGGEIVLDIGVLSQIEGLMTPLLQSRLAGEPADRTLHLALSRSDDSLTLVLEDPATPPDRDLPQEVLSLLADHAGMRGRGALPGGGRRDVLSVPLPQAVLDGMVVRIGDMRWVLPLDGIRALVQPAPGAVFRLSVRGRQPVLRLSADELISVMTLPGHSPDFGRPGLVFAVMRHAGQSVAIPVDELLGQQLVLVRPLRGTLTRLRDVSGVALLAGGELGLVLASSAYAACDQSCTMERVAAFA